MKKLGYFDTNELVLAEVKNLLKDEVNNITYYKWIHDLEIEFIDDEKIVLIVHSNEQKDAIERRLYDLLFYTFEFVTKNERKIEVVLKREPSCYLDYCSIIAIDELGNKIIDRFKKEEIKRHMQSRIDRYEEKMEPVQFIKCIDGNLEKEIFDVSLNPFIIMIGNEKNILANEVIEKYYDENDKYINIIEMYKKDVKTKNIKSIINEEDECINLLRFFLYTTACDTFFPEDNLNALNELLLKEKMKNINLKINCFNEINKFINTVKNFDKNKSIIIQLATNKNKIRDLFLDLGEKLRKANCENIIQYYLHDSCNFEEFEIYMLELN